MLRGLRCVLSLPICCFSVFYLPCSTFPSASKTHFPDRGCKDTRPARDASCRLRLQPGRVPHFTRGRADASWQRRDKGWTTRGCAEEGPDDSWLRRREGRRFVAAQGESGRCVAAQPRVVYPPSHPQRRIVHTPSPQRRNVELPLCAATIRRRDLRSHPATGLRQPPHAVKASRSA